MAIIRRERARPLVRLRSISKLPDVLKNKDAEIHTDAPPWAEGDDTAFAVLLGPENEGPFWPRDMMIYLTRKRDPIRGDMLLIDMQDGRTLLRLLVETHDDYFELLSPSIVKDKLKREKIKFSDIKELAVISGTRRNS